MKSINQLVYSIASIFAIVSACSALPINVTASEHASELLIGLLALACVSATIVACTCCHRSKSGFEEFENENTIADQTNSSSRSEFPIFRAISPSNADRAIILNSADNNLENRILSNIVNQNQMNRTFNEFENNQNNNGPISVVDMENIQNNNAVDYIPNRNEINIIIEPSTHSINRNLVEVNRDNSVSTNATLLTNSNQSMSTATSDFENMAGDTSYDRYYQFNEHRSDEPLPQLSEIATVSESLNNYIDLEENSDVQTAEGEPKIQDECIELAQTVRLCSKVHVNACTEDPKSELNTNDIDAISVEEALRALDFAISGGESIFSDYQDDSSSDESDDNEAEKEFVVYNTMHDFREIDFPKSPNEIEFKHEVLNKTVDAKYKINENEAEIDAKHSCDISNTVHSREYVYDVAKALVDSVLEECTEKISSLTHSASHARDEPKNESHATQIEIVENTNVEVTDLDDSLEETFIIGKLEASTPCHKNILNCQRETNQFGVNLFQILDEVNESALSNDDVAPLQLSQSQQIAHTTFEVRPVEKQLSSTFVANNDKTFAAANQIEHLQETFNIETCQEIKPQNEVPKINPTIKIDKEEVNSDDLTTITPMNTPIELNYVGETWDQFVSKSMNKKSIDLPTKTKDPEATSRDFMLTTEAKNPWFLHPPQSDDTFDVNDVDYSNYDYDGMDEDSESVEENPELLSLTFDALRKQLADVLPQTSVRPSVDYSDDEDNASDSDPECENIDFYNKLENPRSEVVINYKQQLSPILEESEDETCKTFVMNETKFMDSTSTGCIETSEAIMGVTKVLMASNDTLFNFEDTLGDREDMLSPRNIAMLGNNTINSNTIQSDNCKTPTNEAYQLVYQTEYKPSDVNTDIDHQMTSEIRPNSLQLNLENLTNNLNDLLSPEQPKTFSEEINTVEQLSSDLSATIDATNTELDDLKTCISVHFNDDLNTTKLENSENDAIVIEQYQTNGLVAETVESDGILASQYQSIDTHQTHTTTVAITHIVDDSPSNFAENDTTLNSIEPNEGAKENKSPNLDVMKNNAKPDTKCKFNNTVEHNQADERYDCDQNNLDVLHEPPAQLSGEEDPWAAHPITDIRFTGPFASNDWDSDIEDSNSSEEFLYAKGASQIGEYLRSTQNTTFPLSSQNHIDIDIDEQIDSPSNQNEGSQEIEDELPDTQDIWNSHEDLIAVTTNVDGDSADDILDESSSSDNENDWVPSSWDSLAKPVRSAMKSPEKSSSRTSSKGRRNVVFKKQSYQSVYEYPKENLTTVSPKSREPQGWATYLANSSPFSSTMNCSPLNDQIEVSSESQVDFNAIDGFAVSSSSRPFQLSQFGTECHTWPTDSEFSWSHSDNSEVNYVVDSLKWSSNSKTDIESDKPSDESRELKSPNSIIRPDSGVGELAELLSESNSLGDLCHTKSSLRLPLNVFSVNVEKEMIQQTTPADDQNESSKSISQNDYSENVVASDSMDSIVPTSCTGSMDSINSFDGGKSSQNHLSNSTNADGLLINSSEVRSVLHETSAHIDVNTNTSKKCDYRTTANRQSDSTDEDSGIENIVRVTKEI